MKIFKIKENGFEEIRKQLMFKSATLSITAMIAGLIISYINSHADTIVYLISALPLIGILYISLKKGLERQKTVYESYILKVDETEIIREQYNTPTIKLNFSEITKINRSAKGGLILGKKNQTLIVPAQIENLDKLYDILKNNCSVPVTIIKSKPLIKKLEIPIALSTLILMGIIYISTNKIFVLISGTLFVSLIIWSFIEIQTNKNIDEKARKSSYWLILVLLSSLVIIFSKLILS